MFLYDANLNAMKYGDETIELENDAPKMRKVKEGVCQQVAGFEVFDLAQLE